MLNYQSAITYIQENVSNQRLITHMKVVSICTKYYGEKILSAEIKIPKSHISDLKEINIFEWELAGLLHDADWEKYPEKHPAVIVSWLMDEGASENIINSIHSHANVEWAVAQPGGNLALVTIGGEHHEIPRVIPRDSLLGKVLFACDEMSGMVYATALMKPDKLENLTANSVLKKIKDKNFAKGVNRDDILQGCEELGLTMEEHIENIIEALKPHQEEIF